MSYCHWLSPKISEPKNTAKSAKGLTRLSRMRIVRIATACKRVFFHSRLERRKLFLSEESEGRPSFHDSGTQCQRRRNIHVSLKDDVFLLLQQDALLPAFLPDTYMTITQLKNDVCVYAWDTSEDSFSNIWRVLSYGTSRKYAEFSTTVSFLSTRACVPAANFILHVYCRAFGNRSCTATVACRREREREHVTITCDVTNTICRLWNACPRAIREKAH